MSLPIFPTEGVSLLLLQRIAKVVKDQDSNWTTTDVCSKLIKPWTESMKCSFSQWLQQNCMHSPHMELGLTYSEAIISKANYFVSHAWSFNFLELVDTLTSYAEENPSIEFSFWFDLVVNDQWNAPSLPFEWWSGTFLSAVGDIGHTLLVCLPWENPIPLTRAWCLWEILSSRMTNAKLSVLLSPMQKQEFYNTIRTDARQIMNHFCKIDVRKSTSWKASDKEMIFKAVTNSEGGFDGVNKQISSLLRQWIIQSAYESAAAQDLLTSESRIQYYQYLRRIAKILLEYGNHQEALTMCENVLTGLQNELGPDHIETLQVSYNRAGLLSALGKFQVAIDIYKAVIDKFTSMYPDHLEDILCCQSDIANNLLMIGDLQESFTICNKVVIELENHLGLDNPKTLNAKKTLGSILERKGDYESSLALFKEVYAGYERVLSFEHPTTIDLMISISSSLCKVARFDEALDLLQKSYLHFQVIHGDDSVSTALCLQNMGLIYARRGSLDQAYNTWSEALVVFEKKLGPTHDFSLNTLANLCAVLRDLNRLDEALVKTESCLQQQILAKGHKHPSTLMTQCNYALLLISLDRKEEAVEILKENIQLCEEKFGVNHMSTLCAVMTLGQAKMRLGDIMGANDCFERAYAVWNTEHVDSHPALCELLDSMACLCLEKIKHKQSLLNHDEILSTEVSLGIQYGERAYAGTMALYSNETHPTAVHLMEIIQQLKQFQN